MKKTVIQRLIMFLIGLPLIGIIVVLLPYRNHLALNILVTVFSALGAVELSVMLAKKNLRISRAEALILGALPPAAMTASVSFNCPWLVIPATITVGLAWALLSRVFARAETLDAYINRLAAGVAALVYPGLLVQWIVMMGRWERAEIIIPVFLCTVFANDSAAWAAGMLFGRNNRGIVPASPNKSAAGFIGGGAASVLAGAGAVLLWPGVFVPRFAAVWPGLILGLCSGLAAALGDLGESAVKRSSGIKDSGSLIPGRGGVLDTIDSVALAAPVFYLMFRLLFKQP
jgi:phosphatidate cytidylyltransferase